jgi:molybdopterin-binding protein
MRDPNGPSVDDVIRGDEGPQRRFIMKLSARNVMSGKVLSVVKGATTAHVKLEIAPGITISASVTNESVDDLGLVVGKPAAAVIKSSDVIVAVD